MAIDAYWLDWANLLLRWAHVITAIAWIGSSFYFVFLDSSLTKPTAPDLVAKGVDGELWAVHGGGFYHPQKYLVAPKTLPEHLHWFFWESYSTWMTGFALFTVLYLFNPGMFLVDRNVFDMSPGAAVAAALAFLVVFWLVYDAICRAFGRRNNGDLIVGVLVTLTVAIASFIACHLFAGRAAFLLVGAMMATAMSANVFFWIIPGQRKVIAQMKAGEPVDPIHGWRGKQRSVHNTYFTLPVLIAMLSNHYGWLTRGSWNWLVLIVMMLAGALIRHSFVARHKAGVMGTKAPWHYAVIGTAMIVALAIFMAPSARTGSDKAGASPAAGAGAGAAAGAGAGAASGHDTASMQQLFAQRCVACHSDALAQKNVKLQTADQIREHAQQIYQQVVVQQLMPFNNATQMTDEERARVRAWYESGAAQK